MFDKSENCLTDFLQTCLLCFHTGLDPIENGDLGSKVKVTVAQNPFFLHDCLLTSLLFISALLSLINLKFGMPL